VAAMSTDLLDAVRKCVRAEAIQRLSASVGETPAMTQKATDVIIPTILAGLLNLCSEPGGSSRVLGMLPLDETLLDGFASRVGGASASDLRREGQASLNAIFSNKLGSIADLVARAFGIRTASATGLLTLIAPLVLNVVGREVRAQGLNANGLAELLSAHKSSIASLAVPGLAGVLGLHSLASLGRMVEPSRDAETTRALPAPAVRKRGWGAWAWAGTVAGLALVGVLAYLSWAPDLPPEPLRPPAPATTAPRVSSLPLPGGVSVSVEENSVHWHLARFLAGGDSKELPKSFILDKLNFESNSATLTPASEPTVNDLVAILKAYDWVTIALEGHTDSTGDAARNKQLSLDRANAVKEMMVRKGVAAERISTGGYGHERPIASNETEEGRTRNRRTELVVLKR
jgi:OmpA-OmpF porin, OOP family